MATDEVSETFESQGAVKPSLADLRGSIVGNFSDSFEGTEKAIQSLDKESELRSRMDRAVSYTHLTLPTILLV